MTVREYLNDKVDRAKNWQSYNLPNSLYFAYANVQIDLLEGIIKDFEYTSLIDKEMERRER